MSIDANTASTTLGPARLGQRRSRSATMAQKVYRAVDVNTRDAILALQSDWHRLEALSQGSVVFQAFDLCMPWLDAYVFCAAPTHRAHVLTFHDDAGTIIAIAPFAQRLSSLLTMAEWIGEPLVQYGDILMDPRCDLLALRKALTRVLGTWTVNGMHLRNVREDSAVIRVLNLGASRLGESRQAALAQLSDFPSADAYFDTFSKRSRQNRRKKRRTLEKEGALSFEVVPAGPKAAGLMTMALGWKMTWLAERGLSSRAFMDPRALDTLRTIVARQSPCNPFTLFVQKIDGRPVAIEVGLVGPHGNAAFMGTYDPALEALSAGKVQMESSIIHGHDAGWAAYDMLAPMSDYKRSWSTRTLDVADYMVPLGVAGLVYRDGWLRGLRPLLRRLWDALPARLRAIALRKSGLTSF